MITRIHSPPYATFGKNQGGDVLFFCIPLFPISSLARAVFDNPKMLYPVPSSSLLHMIPKVL